jgi:hypothetical protein
MRTTLMLADDVFLAARQQAARDHISLGEAVSRLARLGAQTQARAGVAHGPLNSEFSVLPSRDETVMTDHVRRLMEQEGI